jgi:molecular chaperone DnaK
MLRDNADKISESDRHKIEEAISAAKEALKGDDAAAIKAASDRLNEVWQPVSAELYKRASEKAQTGRPETEQQAEPKKGDEVIDAEVVEEQKR